MGDTGPCGPCSEIFYDHGDKIKGGPPGSADADGDRFVEIWNLVFMQFEQLAGGERVALPRPSIDTGMGLERIAAVMQGTHDNYAIDLFRTLIAASVDLTGVPASGAHAPSHRIIADHLRASSFLIADGVLPSNEGRGYVLRRVMRRAMRHAHILGAEQPLLYRLVPTLVGEMGRAYHELERGQSPDRGDAEARGDPLPRDARARPEAARRGGQRPEARRHAAGRDRLQALRHVRLPLDLTEDALRAKGSSIDAERLRRRHGAAARRSTEVWAGSGEAETGKLWFELKEQVGATEFLGYETETASAEIVALVKEGAHVETLNEGERGIVIVNQTPFYGESGGQIGDRGRLMMGKSTSFNVEDTQKKVHGLYLHDGVVEKGALHVGDQVALEVDHGRRAATRAHHSATHLLHEALRQVLGGHVAQKGSLVEPGRLRFDFSHQKPMTHEEIRAVEDLANAMILQNEAVETHLMTPDQAIAQGALALFGEKYGDEVRVVSMGSSDKSTKSGHAYSIELCGGTHVRRTGDIGLLKIVSESAVASGVRRIEALTGEAARFYLAAQDERVREAAELLKVTPDEMINRLAAIIDERRKLERQLADAKRELALGGGAGSGGDGAGAAMVRDLGKVKLLARTVHGVAPKDLRGLVDDAKKQLGSGVVAVIGVSDEGKAGLVVGVTADLTGTYDAVELARIGAEALGGKGGGGRPDLAQAGGPHGAHADKALEAIAAKIAGGEGASPSASEAKRRA